MLSRPESTEHALLAATADGLRQDMLGLMPASDLRDYYRWGLDPDQPHYSLFLHATGATQLANLTATLLAGLVDDADWPAMTRHVARMNVYQVCEVISDDLGIGVLPLVDHWDAPAAQGDLLRRFNAAMGRRLHGPAVPASDLLADLAPVADRFSLLDHSLAGATHRMLAARYRPSAVRFGLWPALVANMESCAALADSMADNPLAGLIRDGLANRYRAVGSTVSGRHLPLVELAAVGAHAILVAPTLAFYIGALADVSRTPAGLAAVVRDGTLYEALYDAAVLVRLLNDLGSALLRPGRSGRHALLTAVNRAYRGDPGRYQAIGPLLLAAAPPAVGSRLLKDLRFAEFNVCLYALRLADTVPEAMATLAASLDYFAGLYALHRSRLDAALARLASRLGDARPTVLIRRFVEFHERLYAKPYDHTDGDYAN